jgi:hypothetical protein
MNTESAAILEHLIRQYGLGWLIDMSAPPEEAIPFFLEQLEQISAEHRKRFDEGIRLSPESLRTESERNPHRIRAFLQALGVSRNPEMLLMVHQLLQGRTIREVTMEYHEQESFHLRITLDRQGSESEEGEKFETDDISDAALLRHLGITHADGRPLFHGFFPLPQFSRE